MMYNCQERFSKGKFLFIVLIILFYLLYVNILLAAESPSKYILVYKDLYKYAENESQIINQYIELKSYGLDVLLVQISDFNKKEFKQDDIIIIAASSFDSSEEYQSIVNTESQVRILDNNRILSMKGTSGKALFMIAIDSVYPVSDLNKLMDISEMLYDRGISFIVNIMPVYDNYQMKAFDRYINVLKYVRKKGGNLFIHFPVENQDGTYNQEPVVGLKKSLNEYRKRGLHIQGITMAEDRLFTGLKTFSGLSLPFILLTESDRKISSDNDFLYTSGILNDYIIIDGINIDNLDPFVFLENEKLLGGHRSIYISLSDRQDKILNLFNIFSKKNISISDFKVENYSTKLKQFANTHTNEVIFTEKRSQLDMFKENEMEKITGDNISGETPIRGYNISGVVKNGIRVVFFMIILLIIQLIMGRYFDIKKFFRD